MLAFLPSFLRVPLVMLLIALSTVGHCSLLFVVAFCKWLLPFAPMRRLLNRVLIVIAESWIAFNSGLMTVFTRTIVSVEGLDGLKTDGHYLVLANHQSWVDILVLQKVFNRRIPFLRFFLKQELIWVPFLGLAWWALDFPFMKRYTKSELAKRPDLAGKDIEATRRACEKFRDIPVSVMNFVEGTRFTAEKHARQASPYVNLLKPKAGGVAFLPDAMGEGLHSMIHLTIVQPGGRAGDARPDRQPHWSRARAGARQADPAGVPGGRLRNRPGVPRAFPAVDERGLAGEGRGHHASCRTAAIRRLIAAANDAGLSARRGGSPR